MIKRTMVKMDILEECDASIVAHPLRGGQLKRSTA
jgi:hypothetical protein